VEALFHTDFLTIPQHIERCMQLARMMHAARGRSMPHAWAIYAARKGDL
jgi:hypothetical protein